MRVATRIYLRASVAVVLLVIVGCAAEDKPPARDLGIGRTIRVDFEAHPSQKYGFDDYSSRYFAWMSVEKGQSEHVIAKVLPESVFANVYLVPDNTAIAEATPVAPSALGSATSTVTVDGKANGVMKLDAKYTSDTSVLPPADANSIGQMQVAVYEQRELNVYVVTVNETNAGAAFTLTKEEIESKLEYVYSQAVMRWNVTVGPPVTTTYDSDGNGSVAVKNTYIPFLESWRSSDLGEVVKAVMIPEFADKVIYLVIKCENPGLYGQTELNENIAFVFKNTPAELRTLVLAHELGHTVGLHDLYNSSSGKADIQNLMNNREGKLLRKNQWDIINKAGKTPQ